MRKPLILSAALLCWWTALARAQIPVIDASNLAENGITALQSTLTTIEQIFQSAQWVLNLTPLDDISTAGGIAEDMQLLGQLVEQAQGLSYDLASLEAQIDALFNLDTAPDTSSGLQERLTEIRRVKWQCYSYAMKVQTLMRTALRTVEHLQGLLDTVGQILGTKQGHQTHAQVTTVAAKHLANLDTQMASFNRAQAVDRMEELLTLESLRRINCHVWEREC